HDLPLSGRRVAGREGELARHHVAVVHGGGLQLLGLRGPEANGEGAGGVEGRAHRSARRRLSAAVEVPAEAVARAAAAEARRRAGGERGRPARDGAVREREAHARRLRGHAAVLAGGEGLELARRDRRAVEANGERAL